MGGAAALRLLLDTHIWLWSHLDPARLGAEVARRLRDPETELWLSPISVWETMLLIERGRVEVVGDAAAWVNVALGALPIHDAPLTREVAIASRAVELPHEDPADRFIAASAIVHDLTLATADERLLGSSEFSSLPDG